MKNSMLPSLVKIYEEQEKLGKKVANIQRKCKHPEKHLNKKYESNTGNYDPSSDCYWITFYCSRCNKCWRENQ